MIENLKDIGNISYFVVLGVMGIITVTYIRKLIFKLESLPDMSVLLKKVDDLVEKVQHIFNSHEITKEKFILELNQIKNRIDKIEQQLDND